MTSPVGADWQTVSYSKSRPKHPARPPKSWDRKSLVGRVQKEELEESKHSEEPQAPRRPQVSEASPFRTVLNVHQDDIHCCLRLEDGFITGSKDGSLRKWGFDGKLACKIYSPPKINYNSWITALSPLGETWLSGTRDAYLDQWDSKGEHIASLHKPVSKDEEKELRCKARNIQRIHCISEFPAEKNVYIVGMAANFSLYRSDTGEFLGGRNTSKNDWVYCLRPLSAREILVVTGPRLDLYTRIEESFDRWKQTSLIQEQRIDHPENEQVRPFISAITPLQSSEHQFGLAVFDGSVKLFDLKQQRVFYAQKEHVHRVWTIENIGPSEIASCGDDGFIKIWDVRKNGSAATLQDNKKVKARVSILLQISEQILMSGSCPDQVFDSEDKARLSFWDLRKI